MRKRPTSQKRPDLRVGLGLVALLGCADKAPPARFSDPPPPALARPVSDHEPATGGSPASSAPAASEPGSADPGESGEVSDADTGSPAEPETGSGGTNEDGAEPSPAP